MGFLTMLQRVSAAWTDDRAWGRADAQQVHDALGDLLGAPAPGDLPGTEALDAAAAQAAARWDPQRGGLDRTPKFPADLPLEALILQHQRTGDPEPLRIVTTTLHAMASGGIRDQLGGGFHRYALDPDWRVPHFEQMLYDNAQLAVVYLDAAAAADDPALADVARGVLQWLDQRFSAPDGAFYAAFDADGPVPGAPDRHEEGRPYTWTPAEIRAALPPDLAELAITAWDVRDDGPVDGRNTLALHGPAPFGLDAARKQLLAVRDALPQPARDDKVVTAWNGLAVSAFARAALALQEPTRAERAARAADAVWAGAWHDGQLSRTAARTSDGVLEDYADLAAGLVDLFEATAEPRWLQRALLLDAVVQARFTAEDGGLWRTAGDPTLPRERPDHDGPEPSGASVHARTLYRLAALTGDDAYRARGDAILRSLAGRIGALPAMLPAVDWRADDPVEVVVVAPTGADASAWAAAIQRGPRHRVQLVVEADQVDAVAAVAPVVAGKVARDGQITGYVCHQGACRAPATTLAAFAAALAPTEFAPLRDKAGSH
ncbi:MAG: thioredoxin domain-containing protein [Myxococcota bacterium]